jgi:hypothetical protein
MTSGLARAITVPPARPKSYQGPRDRPGDTPGYHPLVREFSLTEGAARGTRGRLGPRGRDQRGLVAGTRCSNLGSGRGSR